MQTAIDRDTAMICEVSRSLLGDIHGEVFTNSALEPFIEHADSLHPGTGDRRLAALVAVYAMDAHGWPEMAESTRRSIAMGIL